jgi:methionyl-tRNA formyltransferase
VDAPNGELWIQTGEGALAIRELQLEGKRRMSTAEFLHGHVLSVRNKFEYRSLPTG